jgi:hypothetical protein
MISYPFAHSSRCSVFLKLFVLVVLLTGSLFAQVKYAKGRIILNNGVTIEGKELKIGVETATMTVGSQIMTYQLADVNQIMAKKGLGRKVGTGCGGGCLALSVATYLTPPVGKTVDAYGNEVDWPISQFAVGAAFWAAVFYGGGWIIGAALDDWTIVYFPAR